jgi:hypothetical protein
LALSAPTWLKGRTVKLEVSGEELASPIQITDPGILKSFNIWNGLGVRINNEPAQLDLNNQAGAFIDWPNNVDVDGTYKLCQDTEGKTTFEKPLAVKY